MLFICFIFHKSDACKGQLQFDYEEDFISLRNTILFYIIRFHITIILYSDFNFMLRFYLILLRKLYYY